jgi:subtilisin family serine protease
MVIYKVFPRGDFFALGAAIEQAVLDGVDVINMSLGSKDFSHDIADNIESAKESGIACIVAAGNSSDEVQFPANLTTAIAVSAFGMIGFVPRDSVHANTVHPNYRMADGSFSPKFTCFGASIDFTGPGVGIISCVPGGGFRALDGTSMAAPHLSGLAALYLAHDPALRTAERNSSRVELLVDRLRRASQRLTFGAARVGAGFPLYTLS